MNLANILVGIIAEYPDLVAFTVGAVVFSVVLILGTAISTED